MSTPSSGPAMRCVAIHPSDMAVALAISSTRMVHVHGPRQAPSGSHRRVLPVYPATKPGATTPCIPIRADTSVSNCRRRPTLSTPAYLKIPRSAQLRIRPGVGGGRTTHHRRHDPRVPLPSAWVASPRIGTRGGVSRGRRQPARAATDRGVVSNRVAARLAMAGAQPLEQNGFKVDLGRHSVIKALELATSLD